MRNFQDASARFLIPNLQPKCWHYQTLHSSTEHQEPILTFHQYHFFCLLSPIVTYFSDYWPISVSSEKLPLANETFYSVPFNWNVLTFLTSFLLPSSDSSHIDDTVSACENGDDGFHRLINGLFNRSVQTVLSQPRVKLLSFFFF